MKFVVYSNSPTARSGYGVQTALLVDQLCRDGHQVAVVANWPVQQGVHPWTTPSGHTIPVYPVGQTRDHLHSRILHFFDGNPRAGWVITLMDVWGILNPFLRDFNVVAWTPIDHHPVQPAVVGWLEHNNVLPVAMSQHGQAELLREGFAARYAPLALDTAVYRPTFKSSTTDTTARELFHLPADAFVVGMVAMNKDPQDRKGFNEAFRGFSLFQRQHPNAVLFVHSDPHGLGINLRELAKSCGIHPTSIVFTDDDAYDLGLPASYMAAAYTAMDVLLAPSAGEGFCVPLIEAQACGTPVICSDFTAQSELVGNGWLLDGQPVWDQSNQSNYFRCHIADVAAKLEAAYTADLPAMSAGCIAHAARYDISRVYAEFWQPLIRSLEPPAVEKPRMERVAVLVPVLNRPDNVKPLVESFREHNDGTATLYFITDPDDRAEREAIAQHCQWERDCVEVLQSDRGSSFACKVNSGVQQSLVHEGVHREDWVFVCGDDVEFTPGWLDAARALSTRFDVIGTNDSEPGRVRNPAVANGSHADHFFVRRSYIDELGACLDGPGVLAPEAYFHWFTDKEIIQLAKARGVFTPCLESRVIHHHPGFDGDEQARQADPTYMKAVEFSEMDQITFTKRARLIDQHKTIAGGIW